MNETLRGSCLCGSVTYAVTGPVRPIIACHCAQCRKISGHYTAATQAPAINLTINGDGVKWYRSSEVAERGFCSTCGSTLFWRRFNNPNISIFAGTLDGVTGLTTQSQIHVDAKGDYYDVPDLPIVDQGTLK